MTMLQRMDREGWGGVEDYSILHEYILILLNNNILMINMSDV